MQQVTIKAKSRYNILLTNRKSFRSTEERQFTVNSTLPIEHNFYNKQVRYAFQFIKDKP